MLNDYLIVCSQLCCTGFVESSTEGKVYLPKFEYTKLAKASFMVSIHLCTDL